MAGSPVMGLRSRRPPWVRPRPRNRCWKSNFFTVYATTGLVEIGIPGTAGFSDQFSGPTPVENYLPRSGTPAPLTADLADPTSDSSGIFGGEALPLPSTADSPKAAVPVG